MYTYVHMYTLYLYRRVPALFTLCCCYFHLGRDGDEDEDEKSNKITSNYLRLYKNPNHAQPPTHTLPFSLSLSVSLSLSLFLSLSLGRHFCLTPQSIKVGGGRCRKLYKSKVNNSNNYNTNNTSNNNNNMNERTNFQPWKLNLCLQHS